MSYTAKPKEWKGFNINLNAIEDWCRAYLPQYAGSSSDENLRLHFHEQPSDETLELFDSYWDSLDENSDEAVTYTPKGVQEATILKAKEDAVEKANWGSLSKEQRKLVLGLSLTKEEKANIQNTFKE